MLIWHPVGQNDALCLQRETLERKRKILQISTPIGDVRATIAYLVDKLFEHNDDIETVDWSNRLPYQFHRCSPAENIEQITSVS